MYIFAEYNFYVKYKPGRLNGDDAVSRRPNFEPGAHSNMECKLTVASLLISVLSLTLLDDLRKSYAGDKDLPRWTDLLAIPARKFLADLPTLCRFSLDRYTTRNGLLYCTYVADYTHRVVVASHDDRGCSSYSDVTML